VLKHRAFLFYSAGDILYSKTRALYNTEAYTDKGACGSRVVANAFGKCGGLAP